MKRFIFFTLFLYATILFLTYGNLPKTFFQQDEWAIFGYHISADKLGISLFNRLFIHQQESHLNPFSNIATLIQFRLFGVQFAPYAWVAMMLHGVNTVLVYVLSWMLIKNRWLALFAGIFFLINSIGHQAIVWIATTTGTAGSTLIFLLSVIAGISYIQSGERRRDLLGLTMLGLVISLGFKETTVFGFILIPILWMIFTKKRSLGGGIRVGAAVTLSGALYLIARFMLLALRSAPSISPEVVTRPSFDVYVFRTVVIPVRVFVQSFIPQELHLVLARLAMRLGYPQFMIGGAPNPYLVESAAADIITLAGLLGIVVVIVLLRRSFQKTRQMHLSRVLSFVCAGIWLSALPFIFIPGRAGYNALLDGRHLYLTSAFVSIFAALMVAGIVGKVKKNRPIMALLCMGIFLVGFYHIRIIRRDILNQVTVAKLRQSIVGSVLTYVPVLPRRAVFYVESDAAYYGVAEPIVPFQSGFGQVLLVWYSATGMDFPACLFESEYLYIQMEENFKECEGRGFGYFRKPVTFNEALAVYKFLPDELFAFRFTSATNTFEDTTADMRRKLATFGRL